MHILSHVISLLHQGDRQEHRRTRLATEVDTLSRTIVHAYNLVIDRVNTDETATGVTTSRKEILIGLLLNDAHLTTLCHIHIVEVAPIAHLRFTHSLIVLLHTIDADSGLTITEIGRTTIREKHRTHHFEFWYATLQTLHVLVLHIPSTPLAKTLVSLCGRLCPNHSTIGSEPFEVLIEQFLHTLSATNQRHQHEDTPKHPEARQERTTLVARQRIENLSICIYIKSHISSQFIISRHEVLLWDGFDLL